MHQTSDESKHAFQILIKKIMCGSLLTTKEWFGRKRDLRIRLSNFILSVESNPESPFVKRKLYSRLVGNPETS